MVRYFTIIIITLFSIGNIDAQSIWNSGERTQNFIISLETGQGWTNWPVPTFAPNSKIDGETPEQIVSDVYWGPGSDRMTRLSVMFRKNRLKIGGGIQQDRLSIQRYDASGGYTGTNLLQFSTLAFFAQAEYYLTQVGPLASSVSMRFGKFFSTTDHEDVLNGTTSIELGLPFEFLLTDRLGFVVNPSVGVRNIKGSETNDEKWTAKQYGLTAGLRMSF